MTHWNPQQVGQLLSLLLAQAVPSVGDKDHGHQELSLRVDQLAKGCSGSRNGGPASHQHPIDVKQEPKGRQHAGLGGMKSKGALVMSLHITSNITYLIEFTATTAL